MSRAVRQLKTLHLMWRIAWPDRRSLFRRVAGAAAVTERSVVVANAALTVREYRPKEPGATIILNGGFVPESIDDPRLINFALALAEVGFLVLTPDFPAVRTLDFDPTTIDQITGVIEYARRDAEIAGLRPLIVLGLSYMGTLSLKAALRPDVAAPPELVGVFGGYADFGDLMRDVFSDVYPGDGEEVRVDPYGRFLVLRSALAYFDAPASERSAIRSIMLAMGRKCDPGDVARLSDGLSPAGRACVAALRRFHPDRAPDQWRRIVDGSRSLIEALSVREPPESLRSGLMILHSVYDHILPCSGSRALHRHFPDSDLVVTTLFTHVNVRVSLRTVWRQAREIRALFRLFGRIVGLGG